MSTKKQARTLSVTTMAKYCCASLAIGLAGCKVDSHTQMFVSDLTDAMNEPTEVFVVDSEYRFEVPNTNACQANVGKSTEVLSRYFADVGDVKCSKEGVRDYMSFSTKSPITFGQKANGYNLPGNAVAGYGVTKPADDKLALYALLHRQRMDTMLVEFKQVFRAPGSVNIELQGVTITLQNDLNSAVEISGPASFINDEPQLVTNAKIDRRSRSKITMSDVAEASLQKEGVAFLVLVSIP
jgi:hypothetical protein